MIFSLSSSLLYQAIKTNLLQLQLTTISLSLLSISFFSPLLTPLNPSTNSAYPRSHASLIHTFTCSHNFSLFHKTPILSLALSLSDKNLYSSSSSPTKPPEPISSLGRALVISTAEAAIPKLVTAPQSPASADSRPAVHRPLRLRNRAQPLRQPRRRSASSVAPSRRAALACNPSRHLLRLPSNPRQAADRRPTPHPAPRPASPPTQIRRRASPEPPRSAQPVPTPSPVSFVASVEPPPTSPRRDLLQHRLPCSSPPLFADERPEPSTSFARIVCVEIPSFSNLAPLASIRSTKTLGKIPEHYYDLSDLL